MKGFRTAPQASKKEMIKSTQTEVRNLQMAVRLNQMMTQQIVTQFQATNKDVTNAINVMNDLQYRTLAMLEVLGVDTAKLDEVADRLKLVDYNAASDKEDAEKKYAVADVVAADSIVTITSDAAGDAGIFRSKFKLSEAQNPELQLLLEGMKVGERKKFSFGGVDHDLEVVAIRTETVKPEEAAAPAETAHEHDENCEHDEAAAEEQVLQ